MATGASTAHVAIILIDARYGVLTQSRRHAYIASLLGIPHLLVCVNKLDLVNYDASVYHSIEEDFRSLSQQLRFQSITFVPVSALMGVNVVEPNKKRLPWYQGPTVLSFLETVEIRPTHQSDQFRFPVQYVLRPNLNYRGYAGQIASGSIKKGDRICISSSGLYTTVTSIDTFHGPIEEAQAPLSVTLRLEDEIDISRGDLLVDNREALLHGQQLRAHVVWMSEQPLNPNRSYWIKHNARYVHSNIEKLVWKLDMENLQPIEQPTSIELNDIAMLHLSTHTPISFDPYHKNRATGAFILIDFMTNQTVGAGMLDGLYEDNTTHNTPSTQGHILWFEQKSSAQECYSYLRTLQNNVILIDGTDKRYNTLTDVQDLAQRLYDAGFIALLTQTECPAIASDVSHQSLNLIVQSIQQD